MYGRASGRRVCRGALLSLILLTGQAVAADAMETFSKPPIAANQELARGLGAGMAVMESLTNPLMGTFGRIWLARIDANIQRALGAVQPSASAWARVQDLAERERWNSDLFLALSEQAELAVMRGDYARCQEVAELLLKRATAVDDRTYMATAERYLGVIERRRGHLQAALAHHQNSLALRHGQNDDSGTAQSLANLGTVYRDLGDFARSLDLQLQALEIRKRIGVYDLLDISYRNVALLYRELEDSDQARENFELGLAAARKRYDQTSLASVLGSYASFANDVGESAKALELAQQALAIDEALESRPHMGLELLEIGRALLALDRDAEAERYLSQALALGLELKQQEIIGTALLQQGELANKRGDVDKAGTLLDQAITQLKAANLRPQLAQAYASSEEIAIARKDSVRALGFAREQAKLREELLGTRSSRQLSALKLRYERAEADQNVQMLRVDNELQASKLREQKLLRNIGIGSLVALVLTVLLLLARYRIARRLNFELTRKNQEISAKEAALKQANAMLTQQAGELYQAAITDPLTGVYNRGHVMRQLNESVIHCLADGRDLALLLIDFDHFKDVNDKLGHLAGDRVLVSGVQAMRQWLDPGDLLGRYGGEEFIAVLAGRNAAEAAAVAERLRGKVALALLALAQGAQAPTISIGLAMLSDSPLPTMESLLAVADRAMYKAKSRGRNRVEKFTV